MDDTKIVNIEYTVIPHESGHYAIREQKGTPLTNNEALCILKSEMFSVVVNYMESAKVVGFPCGLSLFAMREMLTGISNEVLELALEHFKGPEADDQRPGPTESQS